jgi:branched-chain amino acid transport system substrate-binding protein
VIQTKYRVASLLAAAALVVSACGGSAATSAPAATTAPGATEAPAATSGGGEAKTVNIGFEGPYTGDAAASGQELKHSIEMAMDEIGYKIGDYTINPVWIDDGTDPAKGTAAYEQAAVSQDIQAVLGGWNSSVAVALMDVASKYGIPSFFSCGAASTVTDKWKSDPEKYQQWIKCWPDPSKLVTAYVEWLNAGIADGTITGDKTFAVYGEDTDWGRTFATAAGEQLEAAGWTKQSEDIFPLTTSDFTALVSKWNSSKPTALIGTTTSLSVWASLLKALQDSGNQSIMIADGVGQVGDWYNSVGSAGDYVIDSSPLWTRPGSQKFVDDYTAKFGAPPSQQAAGLAYDYAKFFTKILETAIADSGELTKASIQKVLTEKVATGQLAYTDGVVMDSYDFNAESMPNPVVGAGHFIFPVVQYMGGNATLIFPGGDAGAYQPKP